MSFSEEDSRHPTSYAELQGVEVKISEKYRHLDISSLQQQEEMACLTLKDLGKLDKYVYKFDTELLVLQNFTPVNIPRHTGS